MLLHGYIPQFWSIIGALWITAGFFMLEIINVPKQCKTARLVCNKVLLGIIEKDNKGFGNGSGHIEQVLSTGGTANPEMIENDEREYESASSLHRESL